jgi:signal transduction histidine kinase
MWVEAITIFKTIQIIGIVVCSLASIRAWKQRETRGFAPLSGMFAGAAIWGASMFLANYHPSYQIKKIFNSLLYFGVALVAIGFFLFVLEYTGRERYLTRRNLGLLAVHPTLVPIVVWTNPLNLFYTVQEPAPTAQFGMYTEFGSLFLVHSVYSYGLLLVGIVLLMRMLYRRQTLYRGQLAAVVTIISVPLAANFVSITGIVPVDITTAGFAVSGSGYLVAKSVFDLGDVTPVARSTVVNTMDDGVIVLDEDDRVSDLNSSVERMFDLDESSSSIGEHASDLLSEYPDVWSRFDDFDDGTEEIELETDAGRRTFHVQISSLYDDRGNQIGRVFLIHDMTDQKRREKELQRQNEQLDEFASLVTHDLRNPLNVANGFVEIALDTDDSERRTEYLTKTKRSHERMEALIDDVLTLAREGQTVEEVDPLHLGKLCRDAWDNVDTKDAALEIETDQNVLGDRDRLLRVFENLFRNAVEHGSTSSRPGADDALEHGSTSSRPGADDALEHGSTSSRPGADDALEHGSTSSRPRADDALEHGSTSSRPEAEEALDHGSASVTVRVGEIGESERGGLIESGRRGFFVADDGPGIPEAQREAVLEDGFTTATDGTGLGLSITSSIVEAHGWEIDVTESVDGGARFDVTGVSIAERNERSSDAPGASRRRANS